MDAMTILDGYTERTGWNEDSKILLLTRFLDGLAVEPGTKKFEQLDPRTIEDRFDAFLREQALEEGITQEELDGEDADEEGE